MCIITNPRFFNLLHDFSWQTLHTNTKSVCCGWTWQVVKSVRYTSRVCGTCSRPDSVSVPLPANYIKILLNKIHEAESQAVGCTHIAWVKWSRSNQWWEQICPPLSVFTPVKGPPGFNSLIPWWCAICITAWHKWLNSGNQHIFSATVSPQSCGISTAVVNGMQEVWGSDSRTVVTVCTLQPCDLPGITINASAHSNH